MTLAQEFTSPVTTDWDPDLEGKQLAHFRIPYSRDNSAWGSIWIPLVQFKKGQGPTILFTGGIHGGEYEGPISLVKLSQELDVNDVEGRIIIIPYVNLPAVQAGTRVSPVDGRDLNRCFPGRPRGTVTEVIAHYLQDAVISLSDAVIDLHAGGQSLSLVPYISMHYQENKMMHEKTYGALKAFKAPYQLIMNEFNGYGLIDYTVQHKGKIFLCAELGGAGIISPYNVSITDKGIRNILKHFKVIKGKPENHRPESAQLYVTTLNQYIYTQESGIFEPLKFLGDPVKRGEFVGQIHNIYDISKPPIPYYSEYQGILVGMRAPGLTDRGDCIGLIATKEP